MAVTTNSKSTHTLTIRVRRDLHNEVRELAQRESEAEAVIVRRLLRVGLDVERKSAAEAQR